MDNDGQFTADEFAIAMFLVDKAKFGIALPQKLPDSLKPNSSRGGSSPLINSSPGAVPIVCQRFH